MDLTGARWGLDGAEAILKLRALRSNGNWDDYWPYHLAQEDNASTTPLLQQTKFRRPRESLQ